jgi:hypothetical protein
MRRAMVRKYSFPFIGKNAPDFNKNPPHFETDLRFVSREPQK